MGMNKLLKNSWVQVVFFGLVIGLVLILVDNQFKLFNKESEPDGNLYQGPINVEKDKMYFTRARYNEFEYNFGKIKEGDTVSHVFKLTNIGEEQLIIYKAKGSCDCIGAVVPPAPIMPDSTGEVTVYFSAKGRKGPQTRTVSIITNTDPSEAILTFKGAVE